jgi:hypothetical protein
MEELNNNSIMESMCTTDDNNLHIYPIRFLEIQGEENMRNSTVINYLFDRIDKLLTEQETIVFHIHTDSLKISQTHKYKKIVSLFIQLVTIKYSTTMLDKCYLYDVNKAMKVILDLIRPALPNVVKSKIIIVKEVQDDNEE